MRMVLVLLLGVLAAPAQGQIYKWTDESGQIHFSDVPDSGYDAESVTVDVNSYESVTRSSADGGGSPGRVVMYATSWCPYCRAAREYFRANDIPFVEYDIENDPRARERYDRLGARGVPVILVDDKRMNGFSASGFEKLYESR